MIEVTTGSGLRVSCDDDLVKLESSSRLKDEKTKTKKIFFSEEEEEAAAGATTTTSREAKLEANEAEMSLTTQLPSCGSDGLRCCCCCFTKATNCASLGKEALTFLSAMADIIRKRIIVTSSPMVAKQQHRSNLHTMVGGSVPDEGYHFFPFFFFLL